MATLAVVVAAALCLLMPATARAATKAPTTVTTKLVFHEGSPSAGRRVFGYGSDQFGGDLRYAGLYTVPVVNTWGPIKTSNGECLQSQQFPTSTKTKVLRATSCNGSAAQTFRINPNLTVTIQSENALVNSVALVSSDSVLDYLAYAPDDALGMVLEDDGTGFTGRRGLTAKVDSHDDGAKTAKISGTATPYASIRHNGVEIAKAGPTGAWNAMITGLMLGSNSYKVDQYVENTYIDSATVIVQIDKPADSPTNVGVYDLTAVPLVGTAFTPGAAGVVSLKSHPATGAIGLTVKVGETLTWTVTLPKGLTPTLPAPTSATSWDTVYSSTVRTDGTTQVTKTMTRKGTDTTAAGVDDGGFAFPVTATADLVDKAPVTASFVPVPGWASSSPTGATTVAVDTAPPVVDPTAVWTTVPDVTKHGTVSGTGVEGATITVKDGTTVLGTPKVVGGRWSLDVSPLRPGAVPLTVEQSGGGSTTVTADFGVAVALASPTTGTATPGPITASGTGAEGAEVTATLDGSSCSATVVAGAWTCGLVLANPAERPLHVTQQAPGALVTTADATLNPGVVAKFEITSPIDNQLFESPTETMPIGGTGLAGATVVVRKSNGQPVGSGTTIVKPDGSWTISGQFGFVDYIVTATQQPYQGAAQATDTVHFRHVKPGLDLPLTVTSPTAGSTVTSAVKQVTLTGTGRANSAITIRNGADGSGRFIGNATVGSDGTWTVTGEFDYTIYTVKVTQTPLAGTGSVSSVTHTFTLQGVGVQQPFSIDTPTEASTVQSPDGTVTISGRGSTGGTVQLTNNANGRPINASPVVIGQDGTWSIRGTFEDRTYTVKSWYKLQGVTTNALRTFIVAPSGVQHDFTVDAPKAGETVPGTPGSTPPTKLVTISGRGSTGATVDVINKATGRPVDAAHKTVAVDATGNWTVTGTFQPLTYTIVAYYKLSGVTTMKEVTFTIAK